MGYILFPVAVLLFALLLPIATAYNAARSLFQGGDRLKQLAILIDKAGNVILGPMFNDILITKQGYQFGNGQQTISKVLGINKKSNTLTRLGRLLAALLNRIDPNHVEKAAAKITL